MKPDRSQCLICSYHFTQSENYCPQCGQKRDIKRMTLWGFISEAFGRFFSLENQLWQTIYPLLAFPGQVSLNFIHGQRQRYVHPVRLFFSLAVVFFLIVNILSHTIQLAKDISHLDTPSVGTEYTDDSHTLNVNLPDSTIDPLLKLARFNPELTPSQALDSMGIEVTKWRIVGYRLAQKMIHLKGGDFMMYVTQKAPIIMMIFFPLITMIFKLLYWSKRLYYSEHLIHMLYVHSAFLVFIFLPVLVNLIFDVDCSPVFLLAYTIYFIISMRTFYQDGWLVTFVKFFILAMLYPIVLFCFGLSSLALLFLFY